ncbi:sce7726 family protein [Myroides albus]|nr:sce7726 family protein [Myroides albus]
MKKSDYLSISKIFSPVFMDNLANNNLGEIFKVLDLIPKHHKQINSNLEIRKILNLVYKDFSISYRNEHFYKNTLFNKVILKKHNLNNCLTLSEFRVGNSILDLAVFNGTTTAYEIKSEIDTPKRLLQQVTDYCKVFEFVYLVTYSKFLTKIQDEIPDNIGILLLEEKGFNEIKAPKSNRELFNHQYFFDILRIDEFKNIVKKKFNYIPEVPNTQIYKECYKLFKTIPISEIHNMFIEEISKRQLEQHQKKLIKKLPNSIKISAISKRYNEKQCLNIIDKLDLIY